MDDHKEVDYRLDLPNMKHIQRVRKCLLDEENVVNDMVEMQNPLVVDSRPGVILDVHQKKLTIGAFG